MMVRSITVPRVLRMVCNSYNNLDIKYVILQGRTEPKAGLAIRSAEHNFFDPILDMEEVLEFVSPSHSGQNGLTYHKGNRHRRTNARILLTIN